MEWIPFLGGTIIFIIDMSKKIKNYYCPIHKLELKFDNQKYYCLENECSNFGKLTPLKFLDNKPILIPFIEDDVVQNYDTFINDPVIVQRSKNKFVKFVNKILRPTNTITSKNIQFLISLLKKNNQKSILIVGSGSVGHASDDLYNHEFDITGIDIYNSDTVNILADAHYMPFPDAYFDGIVIQAVLEHVVNPTKVVSEIYRVLKKDGLVYSEIPFMQQVHEGAYDFQRYTILGHRILFKEFAMISNDSIDGPGTALSWSLRYFLMAFTRSKIISKIIILPFDTILRFIDRYLTTSKSRHDSPSGTFFLGSKSKNHKVDTVKIINSYNGLL